MDVDHSVQTITTLGTGDTIVETIMAAGTGAMTVDVESLTIRTTVGDVAPITETLTIRITVGDVGVMIATDTLLAISSGNVEIGTCTVM
jgi:hypothetical protein